MAQAVSHRPLTLEARVLSQGTKCGICGRQSGARSGFSSVFFISIITPVAPDSSSSTHCFYQKGKGRNPCNLPKKPSLSDIGQHWIENRFDSILKGL